MIKFKNTTGQSIYLNDLDINFPYYEDNRYQYISNDNFKRSLGFRKYILYNNIEVEGLEDSLIERNFMEFKKNINIKENVDSNIDKENNIIIRGHLFDSGGYAKVNQNLFRGMLDLNKDIYIDPFDEKNSKLSLDDYNFFSKRKKKPNVKSICIDSIVPSFGRKTSCKKSILYTTVESCTLPKQFKDCLSLYEEVWVTSDFCKEIIKKETGIESLVLPNSINTNLYKPNGEKFDFNPKVKSFVFGSVFNWNYRKGYDALIDSYISEFNNKDDVTLMLVTKNFHDPSKNIEIKKYIENKTNAKKNAPHIARVSNIIKEEDMPCLYRSFNAFVLFSRGEGFCYPMAEASLCGVPVISTNHSGQTMYLNKDNSQLVDIDRISVLPKGISNVHYWDGQEFADLTTEEFKYNAGKAMREVYDDINSYKNKNSILKKFLIDNYNIKSISNKAIKYLEDLS